MSELQVDIVTPEKMVFSGRASELRAPAFEGELGVLPGHTNFLALLRGGVTTVVGPGGNKRFITGRGFIEATAERVVILTDACDASGTADKAAAQKALDDAEKVMADSAQGSDERDRAEAAAELARARLDL